MEPKMSNDEAVRCLPTASNFGGRKQREGKPMNTTLYEDSVAVENAFEALADNYSTVMRLIDEMREAPARLIESRAICGNCLVRLVACTAVLLRKISETEHNKLLGEYMTAICPDLLCEPVSPMPQWNDLN
jgi:hypothetical protein